MLGKSDRAVVGFKVPRALSAGRAAAAVVTGGAGGGDEAAAGVRLGATTAAVRAYGLRVRFPGLGPDGLGASGGEAFTATGGEAASHSKSAS